MIGEQCDAVLQAFSSVEITFDYDEDWGFLKIIAVNGKPVNE